MSVDRKIEMKIAQIGYGIHRERFFLFMPLGESSKVSNELFKFVQDIADIYFEVDFLVGSTSTIEMDLSFDEDNIYLLSNLSEDQFQYLLDNARISLTQDIFENSDKKELKKEVEDIITRDNFTRDEFSKPAKFKIASGHADGGMR